MRYLKIYTSRFCLIFLVIFAFGNVIENEAKFNWIAYTKGTMEGSENIYLIKHNGSEPIQLTHYEGYLKDYTYAFQPSWSPDGCHVTYTVKQIIFDDANWRVKYDIYMINVDGSDPVRLTYEGDNFYAKWSPQGDKIAFESNRDGNWEIYVMEGNCHKLEGGCDAHAVNLTQSEDEDRSMTWSPDGQWIAFNAQGDMHFLNVESRLLIDVTQTSDENPFPFACLGISDFVWSPLQNYIAFVCGFGNTSNIVLLDVEDTITHENPEHIVPIRLTDTQGFLDGMFGLTWSPEGDKIAFHSRFDYSTMDVRKNGIYIIDVERAKEDEGKPDRVEVISSDNLSVYYRWPAWQPQYCPMLEN